MTTNNATDLQVSYSPQTFDIEHETGAEFIVNFINKNKLSGLKNTVQNAIDKSFKKDDRSIVISICAEKGGVGKTTITVVLAQLLRNLGFKVLVIDTDALGLSASVLRERSKEIHEFISSSQDANVTEEIVLAKKRNLDPVVDSKLVDVKEFNSALVEKLANSKQYDVILVDTAGRKDLVAGNFDPRKLAATDVPHITSAYTSNAIIIPMKPTGLDMIAATNYYLPLIQFHQALLVKKVKKYNTVVKIVPSMVEKDGGGVKELNIFKDETQFEFFSVNIRRSEKIANTVNSLGIETLFTTNVASNVLNSFYQLCEECFSEIDASI